MLSPNTCKIKFEFLSLSDSKNEVFQLLRIMQRQLLQQCTCRTRFGVYRFCKCGFATGVQVSREFNSSNEIHDYHHIVGAWVVFTYKVRWFACNYCFLLPRPQALSRSSHGTLAYILSRLQNRKIRQAWKLHRNISCQVMLWEHSKQLCTSDDFLSLQNIKTFADRRFYRQGNVERQAILGEFSVFHACKKTNYRCISNK